MYITLMCYSLIIIDIFKYLVYEGDLSDIYQERKRPERVSDSFITQLNSDGRRELSLSSFGD